MILILIFRWYFHLSASTSQPNNSSVYWSHCDFRYSYSPPCLVYSAQLERVQCTLITGDWRSSFLLCIIQSLHSMHSERNPQLTITTGNNMCAHAIWRLYLFYLFSTLCTVPDMQKVANIYILRCDDFCGNSKLWGNIAVKI